MKVAAFVARYGGFAVFGARFLPGVRSLAGPVAGVVGIAPRTFIFANTLGALVYVPYAVGIGYAVGYGAGDSIHRLVGRIEPYVIALILIVTLALIVRRRCRPEPAPW